MLVLLVPMVGTYVEVRLRNSRGLAPDLFVGCPLKIIIIFCLHPPPSPPISESLDTDHKIE